MNTLKAESKIINTNSASGVASLHLITAACHSILNTTFIAPSPKPAWFDDLNGSLDKAKVLAREWIDDLAPDLTSSIPSHVIDYGTTFDAVSDQILELIAENPNAQGKDDQVVETMFELIDVLDGEVCDIVTDVHAMEGRLSAWGDRMQEAHNALFEGAANIQEAEVDLQADIESLNRKIEALRQKIHMENVAAGAGVGALAVGLTIAVVAIALAPVTGGASLVVAGVGGLLAVGGAVDWVAMDVKIGDQLREIAADQAKIAAENRQIVALQTLSTASANAVDSIEHATQALSTLREQWSGFLKDLKGTRKKLGKADKELRAIINRVFIEAARKEWAVAVEYAKKLAAVDVNVEVKEHDLAA